MIRQKVEAHKAAVEERIAVATSQLGTLALQWDANRDDIQEKSEELFALIQDASTGTDDGPPLLSPAAVAKHKGDIRRTLATQYVLGKFDQAPTLRAKKAVADAFRNGTLQAPFEGAFTPDQSRTILDRFDNQIDRELAKAERRAEQAARKQLSMVNAQLDRQLVILEETGEGHEQIQQLLGVAARLGSPDVNNKASEASAAVYVQQLLRKVPDASADQLQAYRDKFASSVRQKENPNQQYADVLVLKQFDKQIKIRRDAEENGTLPELASSRGQTDEPIVPPDFTLGSRSDPDNPQSAERFAESRKAITDDPSQLFSKSHLEEAASILENGTFEEQRAVLSYIGTATSGNPNAIKSISTKIAKKSPVAAQALSMFNSNVDAEREYASSALRGINFIKNNPDTIKDATDARRFVVQELTRIIPNQEGHTISGLADMVIGRYTDLQMGVNGTYKADKKDFDQSLAKRAIFELIGAPANSTRLPTVKPNGASRRYPILPFKHGVTPDEIESRINDVTDDDIKAMNGGVLPTDAIGTQYNSKVAADGKQPNEVEPLYLNADLLKRGVFKVARREGDRYLYHVYYEDRNSGEWKIVESGKVKNGVPQPFLFDFEKVGTGNMVPPAEEPEAPLPEPVDGLLPDSMMRGPFNR